ncbi:Paraneoplastic antigen-like protein 6B [Balamuthia mandrillaris]
MAEEASKDSVAPCSGPAPCTEDGQKENDQQLAEQVEPGGTSADASSEERAIQEEESVAAAADGEGVVDQSSKQPDESEHQEEKEEEKEEVTVEAIAAGGEQEEGLQQVTRVEEDMVEESVDEESQAECSTASPPVSEEEAEEVSLPLDEVEDCDSVLTETQASNIAFSKHVWTNESTAESDRCRAKEAADFEEILESSKVHHEQMTTLKKELVTCKMLMNQVINTLETENQYLMQQHRQSINEVNTLRSTLRNRDREFDQICDSMNRQLKRAEEYSERQRLELEELQLECGRLLEVKRENQYLQTQIEQMRRTLEQPKHEDNLIHTLRILWQLTSHGEMVEEVLSLFSTFLPLLFTIISDSLVERGTYSAETLHCVLGILVNVVASAEGRAAVMSHHKHYEGIAPVAMIVRLIEHAMRTNKGASFKELILSGINNIAFCREGSVLLLEHDCVAALVFFVHCEKVTELRDTCLHVLRALLKHAPFSRQDTRGVHVPISASSLSSLTKSTKKYVAQLLEDLKHDTSVHRNLFLLYEDYVRLYGGEE